MISSTVTQDKEMEQKKTQNIKKYTMYKYIILINQKILQQFICSNPREW